MSDSYLRYMVTREPSGTFKLWRTTKAFTRVIKGREPAEYRLYHIYSMVDAEGLSKVCHVFARRLLLHEIRQLINKQRGSKNV
jgi:hypothetical protein